MPVPVSDDRGNGGRFADHAYRTGQLPKDADAERVQNPAGVRTMFGIGGECFEENGKGLIYLVHGRNNLPGSALPPNQWKAIW